MILLTLFLKFEGLGLVIIILVSSANKTILELYEGHAVAQLVEAVHYKPEGRGFDSRWYHWNASLT